MTMIYQQALYIGDLLLKDGEKFLIFLIFFFKVFLYIVIFGADDLISILTALKDNYKK